MLRPALLAPDLVDAILGGQQPGELRLDDLLEELPLEFRQTTPAGVTVGRASYAAGGI